jgi:hypothetical protein
VCPPASQEVPSFPICTSVHIGVFLSLLQVFLVSYLVRLFRGVPGESYPQRPVAPAKGPSAPTILRQVARVGASMDNVETMQRSYLGNSAITLTGALVPVLRYVEAVTSTARPDVRAASIQRCTTMRLSRGNRPKISYDIQKNMSTPVNN